MRQFEINKKYVKDGNEFIFKGMLKKDYYFLIRKLNSDDVWEDIKILGKHGKYPGMFDIIDNLKPV